LTFPGHRPAPANRAGVADAAQPATARKHSAHSGPGPGRPHHWPDQRPCVWRTPATQDCALGAAAPKKRRNVPIDLVNIDQIQREYGRNAAGELPLRLAARRLSTARWHTGGRPVQRGRGRHTRAAHCGLLTRLEKDSGCRPSAKQARGVRARGATRCRIHTPIGQPKNLLRPAVACSAF
jgi:hypothetical protein